jgi:hypothetical protein
MELYQNLLMGKYLKENIDKCIAAKILETKEEIKSLGRLCNIILTYIKDFARICESLNLANRKHSEYSNSPIIGKALKAFLVSKNHALFGTNDTPHQTRIMPSLWMHQQAGKTWKVELVLF